jgi:hypothetical protein
MILDELEELQQKIIDVEPYNICGKQMYRIKIENTYVCITKHMSYELMNKLFDVHYRIKPEEEPDFFELYEKI